MQCSPAPGKLHHLGCQAGAWAARAAAADDYYVQAARNPRLAQVVAALQQATLLQYWTVRCTAAAALAKVSAQQCSSCLARCNL